MSQPPSNRSDPRRPPAALDATVAQFRQAWEAGGEPQIAPYLDGWTGSARWETLRELIRLDLEYRRLQGKQPDAHHYQQQFPEYTASIERLFVVSTVRYSSPKSQPVADAPIGTADPSVPIRIGRYQVREQLGSGSFGVVYKGYDDQLKRPVAIKIPRLDRDCPAEVVERFQAEARVLASLRHPNLLSVHDFGTTEEGLCYIVAEFSDGTNLASEGRQALTHSRVAEIVAAVADALQHVHEQGLLHRDIKPENILLDSQGQPRLGDFGLALREEDQRCRSGEVTGSFPYMAPEQASGDAHRLDGRADIWGLGVVLYELLTGRRPFRGQNRSELVDEILHREPKPPRMFDDTIPRELESIALRCLKKPVGERYSTAADLAADLRAWRAGENGKTVTLPAWARSPVLFIAPAILALGVLLASMYVLRDHGTLPAPGAVSSGDIDVLVWDPLDPHRRGLSLADPGALPLRSGDQVRVTASVTRPMYLYLVWIDAAGQAQPVYPWQNGNWSDLPDEQTPIAELSLPEEFDEGWEMSQDAPRGMETLLLLARPEPLPVSQAQRLFEQFEGLPPQIMQTGSSVVWLDDGSVSSRRTRAPKSFDAKRINDPVLQTQRLLRERLVRHFPVIRAVSFSHQSR